MKAFIDYLTNRIKQKVPALKTVRYWNQQTEHSNQDKAKGQTGRLQPGRDEKAFPYPACFLEVIINDVENRCFGIKDYLLTVRFHFANEGYKYERLETFDFADAFTVCMQELCPGAAGPTDLIFTSFIESPRGSLKEANSTNVEEHYLDYTTRYQSVASMKQYNSHLITTIETSTTFETP